MTEYLNGKVIVRTGDITKEISDAVVNAANSGLMGGGGVDGAIHRAGGSAILTQCREIRKTLYPDGLPAGEAIATTAGNLHARFVIHTVGPVWRGGNNKERELLALCYENSLKTAEDKNCRTVSFPAISTGVYGFPKNIAAEISSGTVEKFLIKSTIIEKVIFIFFSNDDMQEFLKNQKFSC